jgi:hypothetical protein
MFNLGYLPGAPKAITTRTETTLAGLRHALTAVAPRGIISMIVYPGHPGGAEEAAAVIAAIEHLPTGFVCMRCQRLNPQRPAPELLMIERRA